MLQEQLRGSARCFDAGEGETAGTPTQEMAGAIDGKHIAIKKPKKSGSLYFNYKRFFSMVLLVVMDDNYSFLWCKVAANGSSSDAGVFNQSTLRRREDNTIGFPALHPLPGNDWDFPYLMVGDDAFPLRKWLTKPYSSRCMTHKEKVMNYRTSQTRRVVESGFGLCAHWGRCLHQDVVLLALMRGLDAGEGEATGTPRCRSWRVHPWIERRGC
ncbi:putative nuclease HARBI1 [Diadema antillarum]|uniref:putative nuclease HARBI1 n=1 Tax=Diadema antillarum TaxID=105358 RepID=UPI003A84950F